LPLHSEIDLPQFRRAVLDNLGAVTAHYVIPVQAKGGNDQLSVVQAKQDIACCKEKFPALICRSVSAQFMDNSRIAMFELTVEDNHVLVWMRNITN
jgi:hypothetical protein